MPGIGRHGFVLAAGTAASQIMVLVAYAFAARLAGPESFGVVVSSIALGTFAAGFLDFGTNLLWTRKLVIHEITVNDLGSKIFVKSLIGTSIVTILSIILSFIVEIPFIAAAMIACSLLMGQAMQVGARASGSGSVLASGMLLDRAVLLLSLAISCVTHVGAANGLWIGTVLGALAGGWLAWRRTPDIYRIQFTKISYQNPWRGSLHFGMTGAAISAQNLDISIVAAVSGGTAAGLLGGVRRWTQPMSMLSNSFTIATLPAIAASSSLKQAWINVRKAAWMLVVAALMCILVAFLSPVIVRVILGSEFDGAAPVLSILALATLVAVVNQPMAGALQVMGYERVVSMITISGALILLSLVALGSATIGPIGAALGYGIFQSFLFCALAIAIRSCGRRPT